MTRGGLRGLQTENTREVDVRLALGAAAAWLSAFAALGHAPRTVLLAAVLACASGTAALAAAHRGARGASAAALVAFCVALVLIPLAGRIANSRASPLVHLAVQHAAVTAVLTVTADPRPLAAKGVAGSPRVVIETSAESVLVAGHRLRSDAHIVVLAPAQQWRDVLPGQRVRLDGTLNPPLWCRRHPLVAAPRRVRAAGRRARSVAGVGRR
ncbi:MAG: hypothetical protein DLM57_17020 [Pseudonocardiales bacterium]|nr:MAG: hypothetical protein DLM57_17020 [Pseudonocardiales bacterium]